MYVSSMISRETKAIANEVVKKTESRACMSLFNVVAEIATTGKQTKQIKGKKLEKKKRKRKIPRHNKTNLLVSHLQTI